MPIRLVRNGGAGVPVPVWGDPFRIGRDVSCPMALAHPLVERRHARLKYRKGQWLVSPADGAVVYVGKARVPVLPLQDGDVLGIGPDAPDDPERQLRFEDRLGGAFVPDGASWAEAWFNHEASADPELGPAKFGDGPALGGRGADRCRRVRQEAGPDLVVKRVRTLRDPSEGNAFRELLGWLAGAPHPSLAPIVDGGLVREDDALVAWMATEYVRGQTASDLVGVGGLEPHAVLHLLRSLASALAHLHARGLVHRDVAPGNILVRPDGRATLIDFDRTAPTGTPDGAAAVTGTPGYVAPEAVMGQGALDPALDVYGLAAVGYAMLCGRPPAEGATLLDTLGASQRRPATPSALGIEVPPAMESLLLDGLSTDPEARPSMKAIHRQLGFAEAQLGLGGDV